MNSSLNRSLCLQCALAFMVLEEILKVSHCGARKLIFGHLDEVACHRGGISDQEVPPYNLEYL